jgi:hypothetical protein
VLQWFPAGPAMNEFLKYPALHGRNLPVAEKMQLHAPATEDAGQKPFSIAMGILHAILR